MDGEKLTPSLLLRAYRMGAFPMAHPERDNAVYWHTPDPRGVLPLEEFHVPGTLAKQVRRDLFCVTSDRAFHDVIRACADREQTWIDEGIISAFLELHSRGEAHSVEAYYGEELVGGLYGVTLGGAFMGESMFTRRRDASKVCLYHLVEHLKERGYLLLDCQIQNDHMRSMGAVEIPSAEYMRRLDSALRLERRFL